MCARERDITRTVIGIMFSIIDLLMFLQPVQWKQNVWHMAKGNCHTQLLRLLWKTSLLCVYIRCFANAEGSWIISAGVGFTAVLPCEFKNTAVPIRHVQWRTTKIVFERFGEESYPAEGYEGRVDVLEDELRKGNCSLVLKNVSVTDAGIYRSYLELIRKKRSVSPGWSLIQSVELSVYEHKESPTQPAAPDAAGMNSPHSLMVVVALLSLAQHFSSMTGHSSR